MYPSHLIGASVSVWLCLLMVAAMPAHAGPSERERMIEESERIWRSGQTLPLVYSETFQRLPQYLGEEDTGINVLIDLAHDCTHATMWHLPNYLRELGFRAVGSHALLSEVLVPGTPVRMRVPVGTFQPFAWERVPEWNVVISSQRGHRFQPYTQEEQNKLERWVRAGGGLIIGTHARPNSGEASSMHEMLARWGVEVSEKHVDLRPHSGNFKHQGVVLKSLSDEWEVLYEVEGDVFSARRTLGKGRIVIIEDVAAFCHFKRTEGEQVKQRTKDRLRGMIRWAASATQREWRSRRDQTQ